MLTVFTVPKPFKGHIGLIQRNAIKSWIQAFPGAQIILFGCEDGTESVARELGVEHVPHINSSRHGAPLVDDIFSKARQRALHPVLCFVNSDIIFRVTAPPLGLVSEPFLMVGESFEASINSDLDLQQPEWQAAIRTETQSRGPYALDYFIYSSDLFANVPPFRIGRARYDNWLVWRALHSGASVVDATQVMQAVHQRHDYSHLEGGRKEAYRGDDARINQFLAGPWCYLYLHGIQDARWSLSQNGLTQRPRRLRFLDQLLRRLSGRARELIGEFRTSRNRTRP